MPRAGYRSNHKPTDRATAIREHAERLRAFIEQRIAKQEFGAGGPCWIWQRYIRSDGYAEADLGRGIGRIRVHRLSYELFVSGIPEGLELDHLCRNPSCCNPDHLEAVTSSENVERAHSYRNKLHSTHCPNGHERTPESTYDTGQCKRCQASAQRRWDGRNKDRRRAIKAAYRERKRREAQA